MVQIFTFLSNCATSKSAVGSYDSYLGLAHLLVKVKQMAPLGPIGKIFTSTSNHEMHVYLLGCQLGATRALWQKRGS